MKEFELNNIVENLKTSIQAIEISHKEENENMFSSLKNIAFIFEQTEAVNFNDLNQLGQTLKSLIAKIQHIIDEDTENRIIKKDRFNVFDCLTRHHLEELHSRFLAYLLNPHATHDCKDLFLKLFIETIKENPEIIVEFEGLELDLKKAKLEREKFLGRSSDNDNYGFIDIYIHTDQIDLLIENKVRAGEQPEQLGRYIRYFKGKGQKYIALYLTLDGKISGQAGDEKYYCISYDKTINTWLEKCKNVVSNIQLVNSGLTFYLNLLNEKILFKSSNNLIMKIRELFLKEENIHILKYSKEIVESLNEIHKQLRIDFFSRIANHLSNNYDIIIVNKIGRQININSIWDQPYSGITINDLSLALDINETDKILPCIEHNKDFLYYGLFGVRFSGSKIISGIDATKASQTSRISELMQKRNNFKLEEPDELWIMWKHFYLPNNESTFGSHALDIDFATKMDEIVEHFLKEFEIYISSWRDTILDFNSNKVE